MALSADVLGTDDAGHTTWRLSPGQASGTLTAVSDFPTGTWVAEYMPSPLQLSTRGWADWKFMGRGPSATLVEGPHDAHLEGHGPKGYDVDYRVDCAIKDGVSNCTAVGVGPDFTATLLMAEETVNVVAVQVANSASSKNAAKGPRMVGSSLLVATGAMVMGIVLCTA